MVPLVWISLFPKAVYVHAYHPMRNQRLTSGLKVYRFHLTVLKAYQLVRVAGQQAPEIILSPPTSAGMSCNTSILQVC